MSTNTKLAEAARQLDDAIKDLPDGCEGWLEPLDEHIAELRAALAAQDAEQAAKAVPAGMVLVLVEVLEDAATAIGCFVSDHEVLDDLDAYIARHKANAAPATPSPAPDCED